MSLLVQFLLRLTFGLALGMAITSPKLVSSGYFRNHLYVTLGLSTLAALLSYSILPGAFWYAVLSAVFSYLGSVCWLYEKPAPGKAMLFIVCMASLTGTFSQLTKLADDKFDGAFYEKYFPVPANDEAISARESESLEQQSRWIGYSAGFLRLFANISSGLLLGITMASMLLGHWYLNSPGMELAPLRKLILAMGAAVGLQTILSLIGLGSEIAYNHQLTMQWALFVLLRWTFGIVGVGIMAWMAWQTLKIPNTQSATGILYVAVIGTFVGETMALLLSSESLFPL